MTGELSYLAVLALGDDYQETKAELQSIEDRHVNTNHLVVRGHEIRVQVADLALRSDRVARARWAYRFQDR